MHTLERTGVAPVRAPRRTLAGVVALVAVVAVAGAAWLFERPPAPAGPGAPAGEFSAARAWPHLEKIATGPPTPIGSPGGDRVRDYLLAQLTALGLKPEVQTGVGARTFGSEITSGLAENVVATIPGRDPTGRVVLAAHYDSTTTTPGTSDDKASVAAILEIVRALKSAGGQPRNDLVILLSDGEEPGLIGAESFAAHHPLAKDGGVVVNLEGPGNGAPSAVYNVTPGGTGLVRAFAATPHPVGESALIGVYRQSGFHSDLTTLEEHGFVGLDLGTAGGRAYYHHPRDTVENFDPAVLQMHGDNALALTRAVLAADLPALRVPAEAPFFSAFGVVFAYPGELVVPLAVLGVLAVLGLATLSRVRRAATLPRMGLATLAGAVPMALAYLVGENVWPLLAAIQPGYAGMVFGEPYRPDLYRLALIAIAVALVWGWFALLRRWLGATALIVGALAWPALVGAALAGVMPGMSYYGAIPALAGALATIATLLMTSPHQPAHADADSGPARSEPAPGPVRSDAARGPGRSATISALGAGRSRAVLVVRVVGAAVGVVLLTTGARTFAAFGLALASVAMVLLVLAAFCALPLLAAATPQTAATPETRGPRGRLRVAAGPLTTAALALVLLGGGLIHDRFDERHPQAAHLAYVLDTATGQANWITADDRPHSWAAALTPRPPGEWKVPLPYGMRPAHAGPAEPAKLPAPEVRVLSRRQEGAVTVTRVRVRSLRAAYQITLHADRPATEGVIQVAGRPGVPFPEQESPPRPGAAWPFEAQFFAPPAGGVEFELRTRGAPRLVASDLTIGLDGLAGYRPRPAGVDLSSSTGGLPTDSVTVVGSIQAP
ncbi:M20/M25/M40 family metallo-hydrolase [Nonomuraea sp. NPDC050790]|uniref:M20/M25/M40 family metallo-hydrolase n=1 Tax=Nonomuraea sp. NPDC050790 TaxID=3364371 RepID=UPI00379F331D